MDYWRHDLRRKIAGVLLVKLIGLIVLWALCFSPAHRTKVTETVAEQQFSLAPENARD